MGGKGSGGYRPGTGHKNLRFDQQDPKQNARIIAFNRELMSYGDVEMSKDGILNRFELYLDACDRHGMKPTVASAGLALGFGRQRFWEIANGLRKAYKGQEVTRECEYACQKIYDCLNAILEGYLNEEQKNPAKWIFLAKNHFGYTDTREQVIRTRDETPKLPSAEEVAEKYAAQLGARKALELQEAEIVDVEDA